MQDQSASKAFASLGNEHRVAALRLLVRAGLTGLNVKALREKLGLPATTMNHHLRTLVEAELVLQKRIGRELMSYANYEKIRRLNAFLIEDCCKDAFIDPCCD